MPAKRGGDKVGKKRTAVISVAALSIVCGLIVWHAVHWHLSGMYLEMLNWLGTGRGIVTVLYNLGLMLALGVSLGFLMDRVSGLINSKTSQTKNPDDEPETGEGR
jgi:hypothetical protein